MIRNINEHFDMAVEFNTVEEMASTIAGMNGGQDWRPDSTRADGGLREGHDYETVDK
jgi:hypothetical protein